MSLQDDDLPDFDGDASQPEEDRQPDEPLPDAEREQQGHSARQSNATELPLAGASDTAATVANTPLEPGTVRVDWPLPFAARPILEQCTVNAQVCFLCEIPTLLHNEADKAPLSEQLGPALGQIRLEVWQCLEMIQHTFAADLRTEVWEELWHEAFAGKKGSEWRVGTALLGRFSKHTTVPQNLVLELLWKVIHCFRKAVEDLSAAWTPLRDQVSKKKQHAAWNGLLISVLLPGVSNTPMAVAARQSTMSQDGHIQATLDQQQQSGPAKTHKARSASTSRKPERRSGGAPHRTAPSQQAGHQSGTGSAASSCGTYQQKIGIPPPPRRRRCQPSTSDSNETADTDDEEDWGRWRAQDAPRVSEKATASKGEACPAARRPYPFGPMQPAAVVIEQEPVPQPKKRPKSFPPHQDLICPRLLILGNTSKKDYPQELPPSSGPDLPPLAHTWEHFGRDAAATRKRCHSSSGISAPWRKEGRSSLCVDGDDEDVINTQVQVPLQQAMLPKLSLPPPPPAAPGTAAVRLPGRPPVSPQQTDHRVLTANLSPWRAAQSLPPPPPPPPPP
eukprot:6492574-Amphidinium_carterae.3